MIYFDSTYLVRLYFEDAGYEHVRQLAASDFVVCAQHGRAEVISAFHRKLRKRTITIRLYEAALRQFADEVAAAAFKWLPLSESILDRTELVYAKLPATTFLRAADALHLSTAAEHDLREIYFNDVKLLKVAAHFEIRGMDVIN